MSLVCLLPNKQKEGDKKEEEDNLSEFNQSFDLKKQQAATFDFVMFFAKAFLSLSFVLALFFW